MTMTNNTIPNVPRELLENLIEQHITAHGCTTETARQAQLILCAPSPAGVDGLEVVGYVSQDDIKWQGDCTLRLKPYSDYTIPLCRLSDAQAIIDGLRVDVEVMTQHANNYSRAERDQQARRIGELEGLLRDANWSMYASPLCQSGLVERCCCRKCVHGRIDDALAAGKDTSK